MSVVLLIAISAWKSLSVRRHTNKIFGTEDATKVPDHHALEELLGNSQALGVVSLGNQQNLKYLHHHSKLQPKKDQTNNIQMLMTCVVTVAIGSAALYIVLSDHNNPDSLKWAYGALGTVLGYWLKH